MKLKDLKEGQIIELRWEYWDHDIDAFEPRTHPHGSIAP